MNTGIADTEAVRRTVAPRFTVLIPSYNRAQLLMRALDSVAAQSCHAFEIVVVDDGSTDDTVGAVHRWSARNAQRLALIRQPHAGTHAAYNSGVAAASAELIVVLGSDDQLLPDALERIARGWDGIAADRRQQYCGVVGHGIGWRSGRLVGDRYPLDVLDTNYLDLKLRLGIRGDKPGAYRRDLLLQHPFPVFPGEPFMRESFVLKRLALEYRTRYVNEVFQVFDYQRDGLSARVRQLRLSSPRGLSLYFRDDANRYTRSYGATQRYTAHVRYVRHALGAGTDLRTLWRQMHHKGWLLAGFAAGTIKWLRDRWLLAARRRAQRLAAQREPGTDCFQR